MEQRDDNLYEDYKALERKYIRLKKSYIILIIYVFVSLFIMLYNAFA
jgi:hypothetical protein